MDVSVRETALIIAGLLWDNRPQSTDTSLLLRETQNYKCWAVVSQLCPTCESDFSDNNRHKNICSCFISLHGPSRCLWHDLVALQFLLLPNCCIIVHFPSLCSWVWHICVTLLLLNMSFSHFVSFCSHFLFRPKFLCVTSFDLCLFEVICGHLWSYDWLASKMFQHTKALAHCLLVHPCIFYTIIPLYYLSPANPQSLCPLSFWCSSLVLADVVQEGHPEAHCPQDGHWLAGAAWGTQALLQVWMKV